MDVTTAGRLWDGWGIALAEGGRKHPRIRYCGIAQISTSFYVTPYATIDTYVHVCIQIWENVECYDSDESWHGDGVCYSLFYRTFTYQVYDMSVSLRVTW